MEYQKINNLPDNNLSNQPFRFRTKSWVEINDEWKESYSGNIDIRSKATNLSSNLCIYADAHIPVKGTITITGAGAAAAARQANERDKSVIFKNCAPSAKCIT